ncbi:hypothetical protein QFC19_009349 [Naganishia cerealis]|uniref:Uncharacterized protein n=1 Tax=Naganishia cerealis TaxID=610337 RepID=A0ACC2UV82_9TREE|nr:hypothetical protein QFC19_009349 [Naganishia cerealis]
MKRALVSIPAATRVFPRGNAAAPLLRFRTPLHIPDDGEYALAIVGEGEGRRRLVQTLLSKHRFHPHPPAPGIFPYAFNWAPREHVPGSSEVVQPPPSIRHLTFSKPSATGEFTDFTARYGALQEEDRDTLFQFFRESLFPAPTEDAITAVSHALRIQHLLNLPLVALSSGQTRRSRIAAGLLASPRMLILEDPFAGLDVQSRREIAGMLGAVNSGAVDLKGTSQGVPDGQEHAMRLVLSLRGTGIIGLPEYVTHIARVIDNEVETLSKEEYVDGVERQGETQHVVPDMARQPVAVQDSQHSTDPVVDVQGVSIAYGDAKVLDDVSWRIHPGERWHLQGSNGSGKTTLLSLILGHHPQSFSLPISTLSLFSKPRREIATPTLRRRIGHASPEIFAAFPRSMGLSAGEVVGTGYEGVFSRRRMSEEQRTRIESLLEPFLDLLVAGKRGKPSLKSTTTATTKSILEHIYDTDFSHFPPNQQALLLFLRAIVSRPSLLILDEASQGMDEETWARCRVLLDREWAEIARDAKEGINEQAVVVVSHWEEEVPWEKGQGRILRLHEGKVVLKE